MTNIETIQTTYGGNTYQNSNKSQTYYEESTNNIHCVDSAEARKIFKATNNNNNNNNNNKMSKMAPVNGDVKWRCGLTTFETLSLL